MARILSVCFDDSISRQMVVSGIRRECLVFYVNGHGAYCEFTNLPNHDLKIPTRLWGWSKLKLHGYYTRAGASLLTVTGYKVTRLL